MSFNSFPGVKVAAEKLLERHIGFYLHVTCFLFSSFKILSFTFAILTTLQECEKVGLQLFIQKIYNN